MYVYNFCHKTRLACLSVVADNKKQALKTLKALGYDKDFFFDGRVKN